MSSDYELVGINLMRQISSRASGMRLSDASHLSTARWRGRRGKGTNRPLARALTMKWRLAGESRAPLAHAK